MWWHCTPSAPSLRRPHYAILRRGPRAFTLQVELREEIIAGSRLKAVDAMPGSPQRHGRPLGPGAMATPAAAHPGSLAATKQVSFSGPLVSSPSQQEQPRFLPGNRFSPTPWGGFCTPWAGSSFAASTIAVSATPVETVFEDQPLTLSALLLRPVLRGGGGPVEAAYTPFFMASPSTETVLCTPALLYTVYSPCV